MKFEMFFFAVIRLVDGGRRKVESEPRNRIKICRRGQAGRQAGSTLLHILTFTLPSKLFTLCSQFV